MLFASSLLQRIIQLNNHEYALQIVGSYSLPVNLLETTAKILFSSSVTHFPKGKKQQQDKQDKITWIMVDIQMLLRQQDLD